MPKIDKLSNEKVKELLGNTLFKDWLDLQKVILDNYDVTEEWHTADKGKAFELKYRKSNKTLVSLFINFPKNNSIGVMIIFGKEEREKFEIENFSEYTMNTYKSAKTFRDGKWVMFTMPNVEFENDFINILKLKKKPILRNEK